MNFMFEWQEQYLTSERSHTDDGVFDDFPKISEDFQIVPKTRRTFPNIFREFPKISEDVRRFPKIAEHFRERPEDVSMIHQRI